IMLTVGELAEARAAAAELAEIADSYDAAMLRAIVAHVQGAVELADGEARAALVSLRRAWRAWRELGAPYESARTRVLVAQACRALGDDDTAASELEEARAIFTQLGAKRDLAAVASLAGPRESRGTHGLTQRELEVLRL